MSLGAADLDATEPLSAEGADFSSAGGGVGVGVFLFVEEFAPAEEPAFLRDDVSASIRGAPTSSIPKATQSAARSEVVRASRLALMARSLSRSG